MFTEYKIRIMLRIERWMLSGRIGDRNMEIKRERDTERDKKKEGGDTMRNKRIIKS